MTNERFNVKNLGQIGSVGNNNNVQSNFGTDISQKPFGSIDLLELANDLSKLIEAMKKECNETAHYTAVGAIGEAQKAAKLNEASKVKEYLKSAGKWALDIASKIGVPIAVEALKISLF